MCMRRSYLAGALWTALLMCVTQPAGAVLLGRLPLTPGGTDFQAAYDDVLNVTWVTDASLIGVSSWRDQVAWVSDLNYLGFNDWRLASASVTAGVPTGSTSSVIDCMTATELACRDNELAYMYRYNLGGIGNNLTGNQTVGDVTLTNIQSDYWSGTWLAGTENLTNPIIYGFTYYYGYQGTICDNCLSRGWALRDGDIGEVSVPEPASFWLFGMGLLGLIGVARRQTA